MKIFKRSIFLMMVKLSKLHFSHVSENILVFGNKYEDIGFFGLGAFIKNVLEVLPKIHGTCLEENLVTNCSEKLTN